MMEREKLLQNIDRTYSFVFYTLGCNLKEAQEVMGEVLIKREKAMRTKDGI